MLKGFLNRSISAVDILKSLPLDCLTFGTGKQADSSKCGRV